MAVTHKSPRGRAQARVRTDRHRTLSSTVSSPRRLCCLTRTPRLFKSSCDERLRELDPVGQRETDLAHRIVSLLWRLNRFARVEAGLFITDRADRDREYFESRVRAFEKRPPDPLLEMVESFIPKASSQVEITDEARHAAAAEMLDAAKKAKRSELALLGSAFMSAAANGDPFSKLSRYETAALNRLRHLVADLEDLQARRRASGSGEEAPSMEQK
jgi:hypothetical protein